MVFSSIVFLFYFLPLFFITFWLTRFSKNTLFVFSLIFYSWGEPVYVPLILLTIALNHRLGLIIESALGANRARFWLTLGIIGNLLPLIIFKYGAFLIQILIDVLAPIATRLLGARYHHITAHPLDLPLGISFYTFHALSYLIDVYRKDAAPERSIRNLAVYMSMFPQLIAGPIIRYKTIAGELHRPVISAERTALGIRYFIIGLGQKVLIANTLAVSADGIFTLGPDQLSTPLSWLGIVCYTLQIYYDFGGYSNMAIGLGFMIGFTYPINFNYPYVSRSMTEFWRRWHISLSSWFRDYVYVPLGGNRISTARTYFNLWIVFLLCGLWHGAAWNFVIWGAAHGTLLVIERIGFGRVLERMPSAVANAYVLLAVMATWVLFRADSLSDAVRYFAAMLGHGAAIAVAPPIQRFLGVDGMLALGAGILVAGPYGDRWSSRVGEGLRIGSFRFGQLAGLAAMFALVALSLAGGAYNPFIYFRF